MRRAIVIVNGDMSNSNMIGKIIRKTDTVVCVNGGTKIALQHDIMPHIIIGDFDSMSEHIKERISQHKITWIQYPTDKDKSDTELAIDYLYNNSYSEIVVFGLSGSRIDHVLANILFIAYFSCKKTPITIIEGNQRLYFTANTISLPTKKGDVISLIPIKENCYGVVTTGLQYALQNETLYFGASRGLSNVAVSMRVAVKIKKGTLCVIHTMQN